MFSAIVMGWDEEWKKLAIEDKVVHKGKVVHLST